jgi:hypothetical protein
MKCTEKNNVNKLPFRQMNTPINVVLVVTYVFCFFVIVLDLFFWRP